MDSSALDSAIKALENCISALRSSSESLELWLTFWTVLVAIGVVLEVIFIICEFVDEHREWCKGILQPQQKPSVLFLAFELFAAALVAGGVSGELWIEYLSGRVNTELRTNNEKLVELVNQKAGLATSRAVDAKDSADKAAQDATRTRREADSAATAAHRANRASEQANKLAIAAEARAEALTPRNLTIDQQKQLIALAEKFKGVPVMLMWPKGEPEIEHIEGQIAMYLSAHWNIQYVNFSFASYVFPGIRIETFPSASQKQRDAAKSLATELSKHLFNVSLALNPDTTPPGNTVKDAQAAFVITVGPLMWGSP